MTENFTIRNKLTERGYSSGRVFCQTDRDAYHMTHIILVKCKKFKYFVGYP